MPKEIIRHIVRYQELSESFIERHSHVKITKAYTGKNNVNPSGNYCNQSQNYYNQSQNYYTKLSFLQDALKEIKLCPCNKSLDWSLVSKYQKLSEPFIEKFITYADLEIIARYQKISKKFVEKYSLTPYVKHNSYVRAWTVYEAYFDNNGFKQSGVLDKYTLHPEFIEEIYSYIYQDFLD
jgi:hypothetical protein